MKKKKLNRKNLKICISVISLILLFFIIHITRNIIIINKLYSKQSKFKENKNYYYIAEYYSSSEDKNIIEHYYKDGKVMLILNEGRIINWYDENTKENILIDLDELKADIYKSDYIVGSQLPIYIDENVKNIDTYVNSRITSDKIFEAECYKIEIKEQTVWITKNEGIVVKVINKSDDDKEKVIEYKNWRINELKDESVLRPDLTNYEIIQR